ncbi:uncharacterized protein LOC119134318 [Syngnathus acus]|uniref:uncharacterized protein LOC119134318 n=1 Tax=Syngnathus acus TaxID=161584 RepID=UPI0018862DFD|nr:uncharacterized protein LOC119134318 [Syngnathus acus]
MASQRMAQFLFPLLALIFILLCKALCNEGICGAKKICPDYDSVVMPNEDFETRLYDETRWITTQVKSQQLSDVMAAHYRLQGFYDRHKANGHPIPDGYPVLISVIKVADKLYANMSWFVPNNTKIAITSDTNVWIQTRPMGYVHVRSFGGVPSWETSIEKGEQLQELVTQAGKSFVANHFFGAVYNSSLELRQYKEIWIPAS